MKALTPTWDFANETNLLRAYALSLATVHGWYHLRSGRWSSDRDPFEVPPPDGWERVGAKRSGMGAHSGRALFVVSDEERAVGAVDLDWLQDASSLAVVVYADSLDTANMLFGVARKHYPEMELKHDDSQIMVNFWMMGGQGPRNVNRRITVPSWAEIAVNYPNGTRDDLISLTARADWAPESGQLLLWTGQPGTGKTFALRALAREWRDWAETHYITDPETFFGAPDYLMSVILSATSNHTDSFDYGNDGKWKLLVLEDAGELLAADAKQQTGQGLSRLLNVVDGLIGQGLRILVLVTTNEQIGKLHPAVSRPGRCAQRVEFEPFGIEEADEWLALHDHQGGGRVCTLATLYEELAENSLRHDVERTVGFAS